MKTRNAKLMKNTISGILLQMVTIICGFILPIAILNEFGSEVNGLVNSIAQFLQVIAFLELGVGAVVRSALYKPLAEKDNYEISRIIVFGDKFFRGIAIVLCVYIVLLTMLFPLFIDDKFDFVFDATLIVAIGISYFAQYYFGVVDRILLAADQKLYIQNRIYIASIITNTIVCCLLIYVGCSIQLVKLTTSLIFVSRVVVIHKYVDSNYNIDRKVIVKKKLFKQKWNGIAQHIAAIVFDSTDIVVLSLFSSLSSVSVYAVYNLVVGSLRQFFEVATTGVSSLFGELWVKKEKAELEQYFSRTEMVLHFLTLFIWLATYKLIVPFVLNYTINVTDANYDVPLFASLICLASAFHCLRLTYLMMILAAGHFRQTQHIFVIAAFINLSCSCVFVVKFGLPGIAVGTLVATLYQTLHMQFYCIKRIGVYSYKKFIKQLIIDVAVITSFILISGLVECSELSWKSWIVYSIIISTICAGIIAIAWLIFDKQGAIVAIRSVKQKI